MKKISVLVACIGFAFSAFAQGLVWETKTTGTVGEHTSHLYAVPKKMKVVDDRKGESSIMIFRLDKEVMWSVKPEEKTYSEVTFAQMERAMKTMGNKMDAMMAQMEDKMKDMPAEQREMMKKMMGGKMKGMAANDAPVKVKKTGEKKTISGFPCVKYVVSQGDEEFETLWTTKDVKGFDELKEDWLAFAKRMASLMPRMGKARSDAYENLEGFPIQTEMGKEVVVTVTKIERRATPSSEFEIPAGYKKVESDFDKSMKQLEEEEQD